MRPPVLLGAGSNQEDQLSPRGYLPVGDDPVF